MNTQTTLDKWTKNVDLDELEAKITKALGWHKICHEVALLENGNIGIALLDVVDDWGAHLSDASYAEELLTEKLGVRGTDCDEEIAILDEMEIHDNSSLGWEETWRAVVLEL